ncbi:hypothetical protein KKB55_17260 [Myxococcota bacterium]|nr:hypothetical protein [Myxococcota bacterium]
MALKYFDDISNIKERVALLESKNTEKHQEFEKLSKELSQIKLEIEKEGLKTASSPSFRIYKSLMNNYKKELVDFIEKLTEENDEKITFNDNRISIINKEIESISKKVDLIEIKFTDKIEKLEQFH